MRYVSTYVCGPGPNITSIIYRRGESSQTHKRPQGQDMFTQLGSRPRLAVRLAPGQAEVSEQTEAGDRMALAVWSLLSADA